MFIDVTAAGELGECEPPVSWIGCAGCDVAGNCVAREEPDTDGVAGPFGGVNAAIFCVEAATKRAGVGGGD